MSGEYSPHYPLVGWFWLGVGRGLAGWLAGGLAGWLVAAGWLRGWLGGYGSLANRGWLSQGQLIYLMSRMIPAAGSIAEIKVHQKWSRRHAGRPAGRAIAANRCGLTVEEKRRKQQGLNSTKKWDSESYPESYPTHTRFMLQTSQV